MAVPSQPISGRALVLTGLDVLDEWARGADEPAKTLVYEILFAVTERSVFRRHAVIDDAERATEFFVLAGRDLAVKIRLHSLDSCAVVSIGPAAGAL